MLVEVSNIDYINIKLQRNKERNKINKPAVKGVNRQRLKQRKRTGQNMGSWQKSIPNEIRCPMK